MSDIVFGPVSSRRFGLSLGVDLSPFGKQCNFDCVYCELEPKKAQSKQTQSASLESIIKSVQAKIDEGINFDFITLTANGEPSMYEKLNELIQALQNIKKDKKLLILSNGTAVLDEAKFKALLALDVVKFSLDSAVQKTFLRVDKALKGIEVKTLIEKMSEFSKAFKGELVMEVLVVQGLNDTKAEFEVLNEAFLKIQPDRIDISTIDRPPAYAVKGVSEDTLSELSELITASPCVIARRHYVKEELDLSENELLKMLHLRPQSKQDIEMKLSLKSQSLLEQLVKEGKVYTQKLASMLFYRA
ncbi:radical SAM protein [Campylobacter sp. MIT 97-5078]|nr:radical SAM protein [Campylobacter sp. MIT 97-5078]